jgi:hypothetical protein
MRLFTALQCGRKKVTDTYESPTRDELVFAYTRIGCQVRVDRPRTMR